MSLNHLLRRLSTTTTTTTRSPISISFLHQRIHHISNSPENETNTGNNQVSETNPNPNPNPILANDTSQFQIPQNHHISPIPYPPMRRNMTFSSAEEAAAERRRLKRRLRIEPPLHALRRDPSAPAPRRDPNAPRLPDSTSALVGARLNLHNRVQSLIRASDLDAASRLARQSVFSNTRPTVFTCNAIIAAMYRAKRYSESISLFQHFFKQSKIVPNVVSYNQIINAHCDEGHVDEALEVYRHIIAHAPFAPSSVTYRHLTKGLVQAGRIEDAASLLREMLSKGQAADSVVYSNLIKGYLDLGDLDKANEFFDELKSKCTVYDGIVNATFMEYWFEKGNDKEAIESYRSLLDKKFRMHPPTGNVLLEVFLKYGKKAEAWALFNEMLDNHTPPNILSVNSETISIMVNECFKMGEFDEAINTFKKVGSKPTSKPFVMDYVGYCNIVTRFCEQGMLTEAERFFSEGVSKGLPADAPSHRAMIDAYLKAERIDDAVKMLNRMVDVNLRVVADFGTRVFGELIKNGKLTESAEVLTKMGEREPKPDPSVYDVVVRGLCDGGALDQAKDIIGQMIGHNVGVTPVLREFVVEISEKAGRREEIEKILNSVARPVRNPGQSGNTAPSVSAVHGTTPAAPQQPRDRTPWTSQGAGNSNSGWANGGQTAGGTYKANLGQNPSWSNTSVNQQQQSWSNQTAGQQPPSWSSQTPGYQQQQSWSQHQGWSCPSGHQHPWANQTPGEQKPVANQTPGQQQQWGNQTPSQQQQWGHHNTGHQQSWANQQQPVANQNSGHQQSWPNQTPTQQQPWANQTTSQQQGWGNQTTVQQQWANQTPGQQSAWTGQQQWPNQTATHQQSQWSQSVDSHLPQQQESGSSHELQDRDEKKVAELGN
ncbi:PREDICTED: pentatricopeptide repeat-containing protein At1g10270-like [Camelina sativa]|uniref:Pentatricopeptide repeat-containing protein At1g10270-like n=1 Tax=Camelina sativa TaxID=90675 RepID=A0ABM0WTD9_CAMSA|nr:PREDICTED: pentatricopeptide repeat-containing protein At1g10270-like [Camelina sativa]